MATELDLDQGYLSRILRSFEERGLIRRQPSEDDARQQIVSLTEAGSALFTAIDNRSRVEIGALLNRLGPTDQKRLVTALTTAGDLLGGTPSGPASFVHPPSARARRYRLGRASPRRAVRRRIWLGLDI